MYRVTARYPVTDHAAALAVASISRQDGTPTRRRQRGTVVLTWMVYDACAAFGLAERLREARGVKVVVNCQS